MTTKKGESSPELTKLLRNFPLLPLAFHYYRRYNELRNMYYFCNKSHSKQGREL